MKKLFICVFSFACLLASVGDVSAQKNGNTRQKAAAAKSKKKGSSSLLPGQYPESTERLLTEKDLEHQTAWGMKVMLNEIYARKGYVFRDADLRKHFKSEKWYRGRERNFNKIKLTPTEIQNVAYIKQWQNRPKL